MYQAVQLEVGSEADIHPLSRKLGARASSGEEKLLLLAEQPPVAPICCMLFVYIGKYRGPSCAKLNMTSSHAEEWRLNCLGSGEAYGYERCWKKPFDHEITWQLGMNIPQSLL